MLVLVRKYKLTFAYFLEGPFSPSRRLAILGGATNLERPVRVLATGTLDHPWSSPEGWALAKLSISG